MRHPLRPRDPRQIGRYAVTSRIGHGGMGVVYLGHDGAGRAVAIKVLREEFALDHEFRGRFRSEVHRLRQVPPYCTAEVLDADSSHDPPYLVMEYVDGPSLTDLIRDRGPLRGPKLHSMALGTATALAAIHGAGVVHRDLKPDNVLFGLGGVKVIDFGIAHPLELTSQHTRTGQMVGTVAYMAPERFDTNITQSKHSAIDVFSWGAVVAYAATGRTPFEGDSPQATAMIILTQPPDLTGVPESLRDVVRRALDKDPQQRPTARELLDLLLPADAATVAGVLGDLPDLRSFVTKQIAPVRKRSPWARRRRAGWIAAVGAGLATLAVLAAVGLPRPSDRSSEVFVRALPTSAGTTGVPAPSAPSSTPAPPFSFTYGGWSDGRIRVSDPLVVSTAYQMSAIQDADADVLGILTIFREGAYDPETLTGSEPTTVGGRPAKFHRQYLATDAPDATSQLLTWQWADDAWAMARAYPRGADQLSISELRRLAVGLRTRSATPARSPITLTYVPPGYRPVEVGSHAWATENGVVSVNDGNYGGLMFARPAPEPVGLDGPWNPTFGGPVADNFTVLVSPTTQRRPDGRPECTSDFCYLYTGGGRVKIEVVSYGRLTQRDATKILNGIKLADIDDDRTWTEAVKAIPVRP